MDNENHSVFGTVTYVGRATPALDERAFVEGPDTRPTPRITPREVQILRLLAGGMTRPEAGYALGITFATVRSHLQHVFETLGVQSQGAAIWAARRQLETG